MRSAFFSCTTSATNSGNDRDFDSIGKFCGEATGVAHVFVAYKNVDVLTDLALLIDDAVADSRMTGP